MIKQGKVTFVVEDIRKQDDVGYFSCCVDRVDIFNNSELSTVQFGVKSGRSASVGINVACEHKFGTSETGSDCGDS